MQYLTDKTPPVSLTEIRIEQHKTMYSQLDKKLCNIVMNKMTVDLSSVNYDSYSKANLQYITIKK